MSTMFCMGMNPTLLNPKFCNRFFNIQEEKKHHLNKAVILTKIKIGVEQYQIIIYME